MTQIDARLHFKRFNQSKIITNLAKRNIESDATQTISLSQIVLLMLFSRKLLGEFRDWQFKLLGNLIKAIF